MGPTNRPHMLDCALTRPGQFVHMLTVGLPDVEDMKEILTKNHILHYVPPILLIVVADIISVCVGGHHYWTVSYH